METVKILLGAAASGYSDDQIETAIESAVDYVEAYCNRPVDGDRILERQVHRIAVVMLQRMGTEALNSMSAGGVSESYKDGMPADIISVLNRKRRVRTV